MRQTTKLLAFFSLLFLAACGGGGSSAQTVVSMTGTSLSNDPAFYTTPTVVGTGIRTINLTPGGTQTLPQAIASAQPGDDIILGAGTYTLTGSLRVTVSGTAQNWIRIRGTSAAQVTVDMNSAGEFNLASSFVSLENVTIINGGGNNIHIAPTTQSVRQVIVRDCVVNSLASGPGAAIKINGNNTNNATVSDIYIERCDLSQAIGNAIVDGVGVSQAVVRDCYIHDNASGSHGIFFKGGSVNVLIERNFIRGIRNNAALQLGGNTGAGLFNPASPNFEGQSQVARNNLIADFNDSGCEIRGVLGGQVLHNTFVTDTSFALFRLQSGNTDAGGTSGNDNIVIGNNLIISRNPSSAPVFARNDANTPNSLEFGPQLWGGNLRNSGSAGPGIPTFPLQDDVIVLLSDVGTIVNNPSDTAATSLNGAITAYSLINNSPAIGEGTVNFRVDQDITGNLRNALTPSLGADE